MKKIGSTHKRVNTSAGDVHSRGVNPDGRYNSLHEVALPGISKGRTDQ